REDAAVRRNQRVVDKLVVRRARADEQRVASVGDAAQLNKPADVDEQVGVGEPEPQERQQALPAGDDLGVFAAGGQRPDGLVHRARLDVIELGRDHAAPPLPLAVPCAASIVRQTCCGVHGIVTSLIPSGRSASTIAFTTAGVEAIVPASPTPLTPSLLPAGLSVLSVMNDGRSAADGTR